MDIIYIHLYFSPVIIDLSPSINHLKITLKVLPKQKPKQFYCRKSVIAPVKCFYLVREIQKCTAEFSK